MARRNRYDDDEPFVNEELMSSIDWVCEDSILHDDTFKIDDRKTEEAMHLSELYRITCNMDKKELAVVAATAMEKYPYMILQIVAEYVERLKEGNRR